MNHSNTRSIADSRYLGLQPGDLSSVEKQAVIKLALKIMSAKHRRGSQLKSPETTRDYLRLRIGDSRNEAFGCVFVDTQHRVIEVSELFQGTIDGASVYPRVVVQKALDLNAAAVVFYHNHPSGVSEPSIADEAITRKLKEALSLVDVRVLDHFVVTAGEAVSFAERGLL